MLFRGYDLKADHTRFIRLTTLLQLALNGASISKLSDRCDTWGVTKQTRQSYLDAVVSRIKLMRSRQ